jgi:hypothetical protein
MTEPQTKITYWACWWRATWVIFVIRALFGFLSQGEAGLAGGIGSGLIIAPLAGLFWGWIYWLIKK